MILVCVSLENELLSNECKTRNNITIKIRRRHLLVVISKTCVGTRLPLDFNKLLLKCAARIVRRLLVC